MADDAVDWNRHFASIGLGAATGCLGAVFGNPGIAAAVGTIGPIYEAYREFRDQRLSRRESGKLDAVAVQSLQIISERLAAGDKLRDDEFFDAEPSDQPAAKELLEGVLLAVRDTHQDKKIPFFAELFANLAFARGCDRAEANYLLTILGKLTFRQICLLKLIRHSKDYPIFMGRIPPFHKTQWEMLSALNEIIDMFHMNLVMCTVPHDLEPPHPDPSRMQFSSMWVMQPGHRLFMLAGLTKIDPKDMDAVCKLFPRDLDKIAAADRESHRHIRNPRSPQSPPRTESEIR